MRKLILKNYQSPGDLLMLSATVRDLMVSHGDKFKVDVRVSCPQIFFNNPYITPLNQADPQVQVIQMHYPLINHSNQFAYHFVHGFTQYLQKYLKIRIPATYIKGQIYLSQKQKSQKSVLQKTGVQDHFWLMFGGGKHDYTAKFYNPDYYQQVIDKLYGKVTFVNVGNGGHGHFNAQYKNCVNLVGKTSLRDLIVLSYHASGILAPVTFGMHLAAAIPHKPGLPVLKPAVILAGGRESPQWVAYPGHKFLSSIGTLPCCQSGGCWASRATQIDDNDPKNTNQYCQLPILVQPKIKCKMDNITGGLKISKCMMDITSDQVVFNINKFYQNGVLKYGSSIM